MPTTSPKNPCENSITSDQNFPKVMFLAHLLSEMKNLVIFIVNICKNGSLNIM